MKSTVHLLSSEIVGMIFGDLRMTHKESPLLKDEFTLHLWLYMAGSFRLTTTSAGRQSLLLCLQAEFLLVYLKED